MILLDTNVVSEWMKREPEPVVIAWLDRQVASRLFISAVTRAEIETGIGILPEGRRKTTLTAAAAVVLKDFDFLGGLGLVNPWTQTRSASAP